MSKHAFWQALVFTIIVFSLGMILGFFLELKQSDKFYTSLVDSELNILDEQLRQRIIFDSNVSCPLAKESLFSFADKIYEDALNLEEVDGTGRITDLGVLHKRYDLLRTLLLIEAEKLKERCKGDFNIISYLYLYNIEDIEISSKQNYFSRQLFDLKSEYPLDIILIPIAVDTGVASVDLLVKSRGINKYPVIMVNNEKFVTEFSTLEELEELIFGKTPSP
jgi:hypothetical protein